MELKITKAKVTKEDKLEASFDEFLPDAEDGAKDETVKSFGGKVHQDLLSAFENLRIHLAAKCEEGLFTDYEDNPDKLDIFKVTGFTLGGDGDHEGVVLTGQKRLSTNEVLNLNTPFIKLNKEHSNYRYAESLDMDLKNALSEVTQYILDGKKAPSPQLDLFEEAEEGKKKRRSKKVKMSGVDVELSAAM